MAAVIHEASQGPDGKVFREAMIAEADAVALRRAELDIVVCGDETAENCALARAIETAAGKCYHDGPHERIAGPFALPHWQQDQPPPAGHSFYETHAKKSFEKP